MKSFQISFILIFIILIQYSNALLEFENIEDENNFMYTVDIGPDEEEKQFLIDTTRQGTYLFKNTLINNQKISDEETELETNLEINTLQLKDFEFEITDNFLTTNEKIDGVLGLGTVNGKNSLLGQLRSSRLIKSKKIYFNLEEDNGKKLKFQYEVPKNYENEFTFCPLITYKSSYDKKYHESWMCEMTHIFVKNEEN